MNIVGWYLRDIINIKVSYIFYCCILCDFFYVDDDVEIIFMVIKILFYFLVYMYGYIGVKFYSCILCDKFFILKKIFKFYFGKYVG